MQGQIYLDSVLRPRGIGCYPFHMLGGDIVIVGVYLIMISLLSLCILHKYSCFIKFRDKMLGLSSILSLFSNEFDKFSYTVARMLDSIYHMPFKFRKISFWLENVKIFLHFTRRYNRHT